MKYKEVSDEQSKFSLENAAQAEIKTGTYTCRVPVSSKHKEKFEISSFETSGVRLSAFTLISSGGLCSRISNDTILTRLYRGSAGRIP